MNSTRQREYKTLKKLWDWSSSPYTTLLASPGLRLTGWEKVRPCAEYNLTSCRSTSGPSKKPHNRKYKSHKRTPPLSASSYMSGELDENYSYAYKEGLSTRCQSEISQQSTLPPPAPATLQWNISNLSTVYLDPAVLKSPNICVVGAQPQSDLAKHVAMQMKPELPAQQITIENRLCDMGCHKTPSLHKIHSLDLQSVGCDSKSSHHLDRANGNVWQKHAASAVQSKWVPSLTTFHPQHATKTKKKKQKSRLLECSKSGKTRFSLPTLSSWHLQRDNRGKSNTETSGEARRGFVGGEGITLLHHTTLHVLSFRE